MKNIYLPFGRVSGKSYKQAKLMREYLKSMKSCNCDDPQLDIIEYGLNSLEG